MACNVRVRTGPISPKFCAFSAKNQISGIPQDPERGCEAIGLEPSLFGTHSMRRGHTTDQFRFGIPDQVIKTSGRWKSHASERYIDKEAILHLQSRAIQLMEAARV